MCQYWNQACEQNVNNSQQVSISLTADQWLLVYEGQLTALVISMGQRSESYLLVSIYLKKNWIMLNGW